MAIEEKWDLHLNFITQGQLTRFKLVLTSIDGIKNLWYVVYFITCFKAEWDSKYNQFKKINNPSGSILTRVKFLFFSSVKLLPNEQIYVNFLFIGHTKHLGTFLIN